MLLRYTPEVGDALLHARPIVALESSVLAQGLPQPANGEAAERMLNAVTAGGATPAITAVVAGQPTFGLTSDELQRFLAQRDVDKLSARDLAPAILRGRDGATTVAAALSLCRQAHIPVFATGGIGGVHRENPFDESADLIELARTPAIVVCAGAKAILDLGATLERLETLGVSLVGYRTTEMPGFLFADSGLELRCRVEDAEDVVRLFEVERALGRPGALVVAVPPPNDTALTRADVGAAVEMAHAELRARSLSGAAVTPFLLAAVERATQGRSLMTNLALLERNCEIAGEIALALAAAKR
ncbi:MAG: pseudouridine-5'-phosphate glycosidase [Gemmatimonadaceae bacterium]